MAAKYTLRQRVVRQLCVYVAISIVLAFWPFRFWRRSSAPLGLSRTSEHNPSLFEAGVASVSGIKRCVYINLDRRRDRRARIEKELARASLDCTRISAVEVGAGDVDALQGCWDGGKRQCSGKLGCQQSHVAALSFALHNGWDHVAVFEDDFEWFSAVQPSRLGQIIHDVRSQHIDWNVILLTGNVISHAILDPVETVVTKLHPKKVSNITRINDAQTTTAYMVRGEYIGVLLEVFKSCDVKVDSVAAIDSCWKKLQDKTWYGFTPNLGTQSPGYSDIEREVVNYQEAFERL